jgi:hypothetical protein
VIDLHIFKKTEAGGPTDYWMYLISTNGVLVYASIEKKEDSKPVFDEQNLQLTPNCVDCDNRGLLLIDAA